MSKCCHYTQFNKPSETKQGPTEKEAVLGSSRHPNVLVTPMDAEERRGSAGRAGAPRPSVREGRRLLSTMLCSPCWSAVELTWLGHPAEGSKGDIPESV